jgi:hypothetical protein
MPYQLRAVLDPPFTSVERSSQRLSIFDHMFTPIFLDNSLPVGLLTKSINEVMHISVFKSGGCPRLTHYHATLLPSSPSDPNSPFRPHISSPPDMSDQSPPSHLNVLFEAALQDYERQTGIALAKHPLAECLQECNSVESITAVLHEQTQAFNQFRGKEKLIKLLNNVVSILYKLSASAKLGELIGVVHLKALMRSSVPLTLIP